MNLSNTIVQLTTRKSTGVLDTILKYGNEKTFGWCGAQGGAEGLGEGAARLS